MVGQFIDSFWRKSFIGHLRRARKISDDEFSWKITYSGTTHQFQYVWIQGIAVKIDRTNKSMIIEDATGQCELQNCSRISDFPSIQEGDYVMAAGRLLQTNLRDRLVVDAYRIQNMKFDGSWPFEVVDISERVYHFTSS